MISFYQPSLVFFGLLIIVLFKLEYYLKFKNHVILSDINLVINSAQK